jgi:purine-binding chemotaxis protein CheW
MSEPVLPAVAAPRKVIVFRVGSQEFAVDAIAVREIRGWTPPKPLPRSPIFVCGVVNLRGTVLPVVDLAALLGLSVATPTPRHVIIVVYVGARLIGLLADAVSDILSIADPQIQPTPDVACETVRTFISGLVTRDDRMISLLSLERIMPILESEAA